MRTLLHESHAVSVWAGGGRERGRKLAVEEEAAQIWGECTLAGAAAHMATWPHGHRATGPLSPELFVPVAMTRGQWEAGHSLNPVKYQSTRQGKHFALKMMQWEGL